MSSKTNLGNKFVGFRDIYEFKTHIQNEIIIEIRFEVLSNRYISKIEYMFNNDSII